MKYVYPAILYPDDGKNGVTVPDLPGCNTFGDDMADALFMAKEAIEMWLWNAENENKKKSSWLRIQEQVMAMYNYIDLFEYYEYGRIAVAHTLHHIIEIQEDRDMEATQSRLMGMLAMYHEGFGFSNAGISKLLGKTMSNGVLPEILFLGKVMATGEYKLIQTTTASTRLCLKMV